MRDLYECRNEIFLRSARRIAERRKTRRRVLTWCISLCLLITVCAVMPLLPEGKKDHGAALDGLGNYGNLVGNSNGVDMNKPVTDGIHDYGDEKLPQSPGSSAGLKGGIPDEGETDMKKMRIVLMISSVVLICAIAVNLTGCTAKVQAKNLMEGITPNAVTALDDLSAQNAKVTDFAVRLFQAGEKSGENTLISPLSVLCALAITANGAENETLFEMEEVLGLTTGELNLYLYSYMHSLPQGEKYKLSLANSLWFTDDNRFTVNQNFLQTNADYYGGDIYQSPFDEQTCKDINTWVKQKTDGMIPNILARIPDTAVMYLVNALAFEAQWQAAYEKSQIRDGEFTREDGTKQHAAFMYSTEGIYLQDEKATGFMKKYSGGKYAFVAMLPNEGISVSAYVDSLNAVVLNDMLSNPQYKTVYASLPKFETEYNVEMSDILKGMGMTKAFNPEQAEFGRIGTSTEGSIFISRVLHKTFISVNEKGTKGGAATVVEMEDGCVMPPEDMKEVYLDRPFVYLLMDCENNIPIFIGAMTDVEQ